jgi:hypothetical protein
MKLDPRLTLATRALVRPALLAALLASSVTGCDCGPGTRLAQPTIEVNPVALDFGNVAVGAGAEQLVDVKNSGSGPLEISSIAVTGGTAASGESQLALARVLSIDCSGNARDPKVLFIEAGGCARFAVRFAPLAVGDMTGQVTIVSTDDQHTPLDIPVTGRGVSSKVKVCVLTADGAVDEAACTHFDSPDAAIAAKLPEIDFGSAPIGDNVLRKVRILNDGEGTLVVTSAHAESDVPDFSVTGDTFSATIEGTKSADLEASFKPQGDGPETGKLVIPTSDLAHPTVELLLKAQSQGPRLCVLPETGLDFGSIPVGSTRKLTLNIKNCGFVPYNINTFDFHEDQPTPADFAVTAGMPTMPHAFPPGADVTIEVSYTPHAVATDTAFFSLITDFQRGRIPVTGTGAPGNCAPGVRPTAVIKVRKGSQDITANPTVQPLDTVTLDGTVSATGSVVPRGGVKYKWRLVSQPTNGTQNVAPRANPATATLFTELDGDYVVELVVGDQYGCDSEPKQVTIHSTSTGKVHIQLTWPQSFGDLDLHFLGPNGRFDDAGSLFTSGTDCFYANCKPESYDIDWGRNGTTTADNNPNNDPTLDIDALWGNGPENVTDSNPFDGTYTVLVHYYCSRARDSRSATGVSNVSQGAASANLKVYVNGVEKLVAVHDLTQRDKWIAATIVVSNGGQTITVNPSTAAITKSTASIDACTADTR